RYDLLGRCRSNAGGNGSGSPQNARSRSTSERLCERLIGTIRRECLDFVIPMNERHLRAVLRDWCFHYNRGRPHASLGPSIPELLRMDREINRSSIGRWLPSSWEADSRRPASRIPSRATGSLKRATEECLRITASCWTPEPD